MANLMFSKETKFSLNDYAPLDYFTLEFRGTSNSYTNNWGRSLYWSSSQKPYSIYFKIKPKKNFIAKLYVRASGSNEAYASYANFNLTVKQQDPQTGASITKDYITSTFYDGYMYDTNTLSFSKTYEIEFVQNKIFEISLSTPNSDVSAGYSLEYRFQAIQVEHNGYYYYTGQTYPLPTLPQKQIYIGDKNNQPVKAKAIYYGNENNKPIKVWTAPTT